jgi:hypothetical protein
MAFPIKLVANELLMCGLKNLPVVGSAVELIEGVRSRHELLAIHGRVAAVVAQMTRVEKTVRDAVEKEIRTALANLSRPNLDGPSLTNEIRELQEIRRQGWEPTLFDGLLAKSAHWEELHRTPQNYGKVLSDRDAVNRDNIHLLIDLESTRLLELTPFAFSQLLARQPLGTPKAEFVSAQDIWALPADEQLIPIPTQEALRMWKPNPPYIYFAGDSLACVRDTRALALQHHLIWRSFNSQLYELQPGDHLLLAFWKSDVRRFVPLARFKARAVAAAQGEQPFHQLGQCYCVIPQQIQQGFLNAAHGENGGHGYTAGGVDGNPDLTAICIEAREPMDAVDKIWQNVGQGPHDLPPVQYRYGWVNPPRRALSHFGAQHLRAPILPLNMRP